MNWTGRPDTGYRITPRARKDLFQIGEYTELQWGKGQRNRYLKSLENRFAWLAEHPGAGKHRDDISHGYHSFPHGQHVVFYLFSGKVIDIIGVLHQEMDVMSYFNSDRL